LKIFVEAVCHDFAAFAVLGIYEWRPRALELTTGLPETNENMRMRFTIGVTGPVFLAISAGLAADSETQVRSPNGQEAVASESIPRQSGSGTRSDPQALFSTGQAALQNGDLNGAEKAFRHVLAMDPQSGAAYSNLGVIAMRRKEWDRALMLLRKAERFEPKMAGIRLNIGLAEYHRGNYAAAIAPFASVLRDQPDSQQARYLLGLCQVFSKKYAEAIPVLEPLWPEKSGDVLYLYLLDIAAVESGQKELDEKILKRMIEVGGGTAEFHLILGKAYLNRDEIPEATSELEQAGALNPNLPFLHMNLGVAYMRAGANERAEAEFRRDLELEPDLVDTYGQLGSLYSRMQKYDEAEKTYRAALARNGKMAEAYAGLAKIYQKQQKLDQALKMIDAALRRAPDIAGGHFLRGRILTQLGRQNEAKVEFALAQKTLDTRLGKEREAREKNRVPNPELTQEP
jgi:tetratricopeptide (TPR) repeat protein